MNDDRILKVIFWASAALALVALFQKDSLPPPQEALPELYREPVQTEVTLAPFVRTRGGIAYTITPLYSYELYGMVVSYAESRNWADFYHEQWRDHLNVKDIGVIWGENIKSGGYRDLKFSNCAWMLMTEPKNWKTYRQIKFNHDKISNNHLLSDSDEINRRILSAKKGDQIYFKGYLAQYSHSNGRFSRGTSICRTDMGNGACETVFVTDFKVLKRANPGWRFLFKVFVAVFLISLLTIVSRFVRRGMTLPPPEHEFTQPNENQ